MKKIIFTLLVVTNMLFSDDGEGVINIANISFQDMYWTNDSTTTYEDVLYSRQQISEFTSKKQAVILYFFDLHIC